MLSSTPPPSASTSHPNDLVARLASPYVDLQLKSLREMKNQIISNSTKKLAHLTIGAIPAVSSVLSRASSSDDDCSNRSDLLVQSAAALGSWSSGGG